MNSDSSFLVLNTDYLKSKFGICKLIISLLALISIILLSPRSHFFFVTNRYLFLYAINWIQFYTITIMLICCLFSANTSSLLTQINFDYVYHFISMIMYLVTGLWSVSKLTDTDMTAYKIAAIFAFINSLVHAAHGFFSFSSYKSE